MKGIVLAGGSGSRLYPTTRGVSKQLLPVYDKPTIYYPISILMLGGIKEILVISTPRDLPLIQGLLGDGSELGVRFTYQIQEAPKGIAQAVLLGEQFLQGSPFCLILGDNIFYGQDFPAILSRVFDSNRGASVFAYHVSDPERFGVVTFKSDGRTPDKIEEKPKSPQSNWAVTGLYVYDSSAVEVAKSLRPSARGELEITDLNRVYLERGTLSVERLGRGIAWLDTGTPEALLASSTYVQTIEHRQGLKIACLEEIAHFMGFIDTHQFQKLAEQAPDCDYGDYLRKLLKFGWLR